MYHENHPDGSYEMANQVLAFEPPRVISWKPGYVSPATGELEFGGWIWRYDLTQLGPDETEVILTYDWSAVGPIPRQHIQFRPFPPDHLENSLSTWPRSLRGNDMPARAKRMNDSPVLRTSGACAASFGAFVTTSTSAASATFWWLIRAWRLFGGAGVLVINHEAEINHANGMRGVGGASEVWRLGIPGPGAGEHTARASRAPHPLVGRAACV
jgi:hypothetical protein